MFKISEYRKTQSTFADYLPWMGICDDKTIVCKTGILFRVLTINGPDLLASNEEAINVVYRSLNQVLMRLANDRWSIWFEEKRCKSYQYDVAKFTYGIAKKIDEMRSEWFIWNNRYREHQFLTLAYLPKTDREQVREIVVENQFEYFERECEEFIGILGNFVEVDWLTSKSLLGYLHSVVSDQFYDVNVPSWGFYLDAYLSDRSFVPGLRGGAMLGEQYISVVSINNFPPTTNTGDLGLLSALDTEYRFVSRFLFFSKETAEKKLKAYRRFHLGRRKNVAQTFIDKSMNEEGPENPDASVKADDVESAMVELGSDEISFGFYTSVVVLQNEDLEELNRATSNVLNVIQGAGYPAKVENLNLFHAYLSSLPGNVHANPRRYLLSTRNLSHFLPIDKTWAGEKINSHLKEICNSELPHVTCSSGTNYFHLNLNNGDVGHSLVIGPTGSGKSTFLALLSVQWFKYPAARVVFFDKDYSVRNLTKKAGGRFVEVGGTGEKIQPLHHIDTPEEQASASDFLSLLLEVQEVPVDASVLHEIQEAIKSLSGRDIEERTLSACRTVAQHEILKAALEAYSEGGQFAELFGVVSDSNSKKINDLKTDWQTFEMNVLFSYSDKVIRPALFALFNDLTRSFDGRPTLFILDEAWLYLDNEQFSLKIKDWLKTLRKKNVYVIFSTQEIADAAESKIMPSIVSACQTRIYLPNPRAMDPIMYKMYSDFGLTNTDINIIASATPKQDYYLTKNSGKQLIQLDLDNEFFSIYKGEDI